MIGGRPVDGSHAFPQFSISILELKNDKLEKTLWSNKENRMKLMPRAGFYKHCAAKLGDNLYIIGGGSRSNRIYELNLKTKQLKLTKNVLPVSFSLHSCATFQRKVWICGPRNSSRKNQRIDNKCWTFDGEIIEETDSLSVKSSFLIDYILYDLVWSFIVENDYCHSQRGRRGCGYSWWRAV